MTLTITVKNGNELFEPVICEPRINRKTGEQVNPIFNVKFNVRPEALENPDFGGGGIYAVRYLGLLLYPGIYTGEKIPFSSNVVKQRLTKHIEAFTMRGYRVGFGKKNYDTVIAMPSSPLVEAIRSNKAQKDNGSVRSYPCKVEFANEHWDSMMRVEKDPKILENFEFLYARLNPEEHKHLTHAQLKKYLETIERMLILETDPRCNVRRVQPKLENLIHGPDKSVWDEFHQMLKV